MEPDPTRYDRLLLGDFLGPRIIRPTPGAWRSHRLPLKCRLPSHRPRCGRLHIPLRSLWSPLCRILGDLPSDPQPLAAAIQRPLRPDDVHRLTKWSVAQCVEYRCVGAPGRVPNWYPICTGCDTSGDGPTREGGAGDARVGQGEHASIGRDTIHSNVCPQSTWM